MVKAVIGVLIVVFALLELWAAFPDFGFPFALAGARRCAVGALRRPLRQSGGATFRLLLKACLSKEAFIATGVVSAVVVDAVRLITYGTGVMAEHLARSQDLIAPVAVGTVCAFVGSFVGKRVLQKITLRTVQIIVAVAM